ncbi:hypothetical protein RSOLAG1IB_09304 [Rhizoctonia solani AG-1 IB]|uniref:Uncharacterized protein n=1 Tax=Thanatephorus cucumeris (strain AG1-IB / isolate 7/3/14) TaxID=1108050 RepID=A0A0B7FQ27_THACB|nr:hypothetical protein RSOLAG1IB_09304 [Rhizoctonia solani AG-1 IB]
MPMAYHVLIPLYSYNNFNFRPYTHLSCCQAWPTRPASSARVSVPRTIRCRAAARQIAQTRSGAGQQPLSMGLVTIGAPEPKSSLKTLYSLRLVKDIHENFGYPVLLRKRVLYMSRRANYTSGL